MSGQGGDANHNSRPGGTASAGLAVGSRVRIYPGTAAEVTGTIVEDFGDDSGCEVAIGGVRIVGASRRWAISVDDGNLVFLDSGDVAALDEPS